MKPLAPLALTLALLATPLPAAEEETPPLFPNDDELRELGDLADRWLRRFAEGLQPMAERLRELIDDIDAYESPERLPNGDIIIRRKPKAPPAPPPPAEDGVAL